jgi:hypothetical protein
VVVSAIAGTAGSARPPWPSTGPTGPGTASPDGELYVNLRGYDPDRPLSAGDALAGVLTALGGRRPGHPPGVGGAGSRYRTELSGKRLLVVADNASDAEQVRPLLPGSPGCVLLVTSRDSLAGLVAIDGARLRDLDLLPFADAVALLGRVIGDRVGREPEAQRCWPSGACGCGWPPSGPSAGRPRLRPSWPPS